MKSIYVLAYATICAVLAAVTPAKADNWDGQPAPGTINGPIGPYYPSIIQTQTIVIVCMPANTPPPCTPGQTPAYAGSNNFTNGNSIPVGAGDGSTMGVLFGGIYADNTSPTGISEAHGTIPLSAFARSDTVGGLGTTVNGLTTTVGGLGGTVATLSNTVGGLSTSIGSINANLSSLSTAVTGLNTTISNLGTSFTALSSSVNGLQTTVNSLNASVGTITTQLSSLSIRFDQFQQQVHVEEQNLRQGVAMSLAMDGVGDLGPDEKVAISMNVGTYGGQNGIAAGVAFRAAQHLTFNAGIGTGVTGGLVGGRAGVRMAW